MNILINFVTLLEGFLKKWFTSYLYLLTLFIMYLLKKKET